jgi:hypothetical protein
MAVFPYKAISSPSGYYPRPAFPGYRTQTKPGPYRTFAGTPAISRWGFLSGVVADYNLNGWYFNYPEPFGQLRFAFYTGSPPPFGVGIHLTVATAQGVATAFHDFMNTLAWPTELGYGVKTFKAEYLDLNLRPQPAPSIRVQLTQPFPGIEGNFLIPTDNALNDVVSINGVSAYEDFNPAFFGGTSLTMPLLWGKLRALGPTSPSTPPFVNTPID